MVASAATGAVSALATTRGSLSARPVALAIALRLGFSASSSLAGLGVSFWMLRSATAVGLAVSAAAGVVLASAATALSAA